MNDERYLYEGRVLSLFFPCLLLVIRYRLIIGGQAMAKLISIQLDDETKIYLETTDVQTVKDDPMLEEAGAGEWVMDKTKEYLDKILSHVRVFASTIANSVQNISDEVEVEFSIKLAADAGIVISSVSTESSITVKLKWNKPEGGG
jgi:hypothetical protein